MWLYPYFLQHNVLLLLYSQAHQAIRQYSPGPPELFTVWPWLTRVRYIKTFYSWVQKACIHLGQIEEDKKYLCEQGI